MGIDADLFVRARILSEVGVSSQGNTFSILNKMCIRDRIKTDTGRKIHLITV